MLSQRSWPGNVRELRNFIERSVSLGFIGEPAGTAAASQAIQAQLPFDL